MRRILLVLLTFLFCDAIPEKMEEMRVNVTAAKTMFTLPAGDAALLDEINTVRRLIAQGFFNEPLIAIASIAFNGAKELVKDASGTIATLAELGINQVTGWVGDAIAWGTNLFSSEPTMINIASSLKDMGIEKSVAKGAKDAAHAVTNFFGRKRRKRYDVFTNAWSGVKKLTNDVIAAIEKPKNTFGPARDMNIITWNRRLAQLAMTIDDKNIREIEYEGKTYRVTKYGTLATYFITHMLGEKIAKIFTVLRIGYLACKLWFAKVEIPWTDESKTYDTTLEIMFAARSEVGCFYTWPDTLCIIGPLKPRKDNMLYDGGAPCTGCKYGCVPAEDPKDRALCSPPPSYFYALREKYKKHLRPKIEKFEVVEGFDGKPPPIGYNFMLDSADNSKILMSFTFLSSFWLFLTSSF